MSIAVSVPPAELATPPLTPATSRQQVARACLNQAGRVTDQRYPHATTLRGVGARIESAHEQTSVHDSPSE